LTGDTTDPDAVLVGVDTGGTFTDFVYYAHDRLHTLKLLSTPDDPSRAIAEGMQRLGLDARPARLVHGTTVATNAVLEGHGARVALVVNCGFRDVLTLGRQDRPEVYCLRPVPLTPPVDESLCLELPGRIAATGEVLEAPDDDDLAGLRTRLEQLRPEAVAVLQLFSWLQPEAEARVAEAVPAGIMVSRSAEVLAQIGEYERGIATWLNASVGPVLARYLARLRERLPRSRIAVMQSAGTTIAADQAAQQAVRMLLSGPAGGLAAVGHLGRLSGRRRLLSFDMGGTSTDVSLVDGEPVLTARGRIGRWPVAVPMVDMHTIGAGGGSIAWLDAGGALQVGPRSAGARPGPACYGGGGEAPTVTDAHVVLGRIPPGTRLAGDLELDAEAARATMTRLAGQLDADIESTATAILRLANEHMARALRVMSAERGRDPATLTLCSFGGAGALHVCELAALLGMDEAMVPVHAGVLSALGMVVSRPGRDRAVTQLRPLAELQAAGLEDEFTALEQAVTAELVDEGVAGTDIELRRSLDMRYRGQSNSLEIDWDSDAGALRERFGAAHEALNGHRLELPVEVVNARVAARGPLRVGQLPEIGAGQPQSPRSVEVAGVDGAVKVWRREPLGRDCRIRGPAIITEPLATTWLAPGWRARVDRHGNLLLRRGGG